MRTLLLFCTLPAFLVNGPQAIAQDIPGETTGDLGWIVHDLDTLILVRSADGNVWLQQNLGATEVATATNSATSYGDLYQWGRWEDGHQVRTSSTAPTATLLTNNPSGLGLGSTFFYIGTDPVIWWGAGSASDTWQGGSASATNGIDPCAALGTEWQLPSQADWMNVLATEGITDLPTALVSNLKLPAAGSRDGQTGTLINAGAFGNYWTSTPSGIYAKDLTIGGAFVNADDDAYRAYGMSCRCINKDLHTGLLEHHNSNADIALFPNPSNGTFTVRSSEAVRRIEVYDGLARCIATISVTTNPTLIQLPDVSAGIHIVRVETAGGSHYASLLIER